MTFKDGFSGLEKYDMLLVVVGVAVLGAAVLPRVLWKKPLSMPLVLLLFGYITFALPLGLATPDPMEMGKVTEHVTEIAVIIALMGAGLKIDRPLGWGSWCGTWRLLGVAMVLSIAFSAIAGWWIAGLVPATAMLLGAVIAPTDPVLASEIQVGAPQRGSMNAEVEEFKEADELPDEDEFRFVLTSEAGLNDGLAFPFTNAAVAMVLISVHPSVWVGGWFGMDVLYKIGVGVLGGWLLGKLLASVLFSIPGKTSTAKAMVGPAALAATLIIYGISEFVGGYGFIAVFVGALTMRSNSREHEYHEPLHQFSEMIERLIMAVVLVGFGGSLAGGLLAPLNYQLVGVGILIVFVIRPVAGWLSLLGYDRASRREKVAISFFGVRGVGSFYYLAYAMNKGSFPAMDQLWAVVGFVVVISIFLHGITATPITRRLDHLRDEG